MLARQQILDYLENCREQNNLAHAYLFLGPKQGGQEELLETFLLNLLPAKDINHPDIHCLEPENETLTISQIRELRAWLSLSPLSGDKKIAVIREAGKMNTEAQNAFLKVLEEPVPATFIFLLAGHSRQLLPTIFSRVVPVYFSSPAQGTADLELLSPWISMSNASERLRLWMKNAPAKEEIRSWLEKVVPELRQIFLQSPSLKLAKTMRTLLEALSGPSGQNWNLIAENLIISL